MKIKFRNARSGDLTQLVVLSEQLGYPQDLNELKKHFDLVMGCSTHRLLVAESFASTEPLVCGVALFQKRISLFTEPALEISGLVVDESCRGHGIGKLFLNEAEKVCKEWGFTKIHLSSNIKRDRAHQFYIKEGFELVKTSVKLEKRI